MIESIILITLISVVILLLVVIFILIFKKSNQVNQPNDQTKNQQELITKLEVLKVEVTKEIELLNSKQKLDFKDELNSFKEIISSKVSNDFNQINEKVEKRLTDGFKTSKELFDEMTKKLTIIDTTQKNIEKLSMNVDDLSRLLSDKKLRGMYGEQQLYNILNNVFGEGNKTLYDKQIRLSNGSLVDAIIYGPDSVGNISIDSKFSLENYLLMNNHEASQDERNQAVKDFKINIKKQIDDIKSKYIIKNETSDQAIMFIPSEAIFAEINAKYPELIEYAQKNHVWITSPTTLVYMLTMIIVISSNVQREKNAEKMLKELQSLFSDFERFFTRWNDLKKVISKLQESSELLDIPVKKLNNKVYKIEKSDFNELINEEVE